MKKNYLLIVLIICTTDLYAQNSSKELDSLRILASEIEVQIKPFQMQLDKLNNEIKIIELQNEQSKKEDIFTNGISTKTNSDVSLREKPQPVGTKLIDIPSDSNITVHEFKSGYFKIKYKNIIGWIHNVHITKVPELDDLIGTKSSFPKSYYSGGNSKKYGKTWVEGHYRTVNGKKVWVKGHYREN